ncbi:MAG: proline--tRNA ligase [Candidatus Hodarchaeota archaeon]
MFQEVETPVETRDRPKFRRLAKFEEFSEWYAQLLAYCGIVDTRFPLKACDVWRPYGFKALKLMMQVMETLLDATGHEEAYFPMFVPAGIFGKEADFLEGFAGEALRITKTGSRPLEEELIVRPTSEAVMYYMFAKWISSHRDLPLKYYQTVNVFRWETKMTKPLLRVREVVKFKEAHTVHATAEEADAQVQEGIWIYQEFFDILRVPYIVLRTPEWDTFAGAAYNYDLFTILPDGKGLELGSVINLGQKFAKAFDITFRDQDESEKYPHQTCYGISERSLGAMLSLHGDDKGFIFLPKIAPIQVVLVPIFRTEKEVEAIKEYISKVENLLKQFRFVTDWSDQRPGWKFNHWEAMGIPIRLEIGLREVTSEKIVLVRRDTGEKSLVLFKDITERITSVLEKSTAELERRTQEWFQDQIWEAEAIGEAKEQYLHRKGIIKLPWCGESSCGQAMAEQLVGAALGHKVDDDAYAAQKLCAYCQKGARHLLHFGRTY